MEGLNPAQWTAALLAGAAIGSFLTVLTHRLPLMHRRRLLLETGVEAGELPEGAGPYNLFLPRSRCPHCRAPIPFWRNIPLLSWLLLRGSAPCCGARIPARYFFLELLTALAFAAAWLRFGAAPPLAIAMMAALAVLLALLFLRSAEDAPEVADQLTQPLLWGGLLLCALGWLVPLQQALWSAGVCAFAALIRRRLRGAWTARLIDAETLWLLAALSAWGGLLAALTALAATLLRLAPPARERLTALQLAALAGILWLLGRGPL